MHVNDFTYELPERLIATHPPKVRGTSRLLVLSRNTGAIQHARYSDLPKFLASGDLLVRNNTRVIKARLRVKNQHGADRELLLLEKHADHDAHRHSVLHRGSVRTGDKLSAGRHVIAVEDVKDGGIAVVSSDESLYDIASEHGEVPLPPYLHRAATATDTERYQTIFASNAGSVAAPTASLNFTQQLENDLYNSGVETAELTLHVGLGTFLPIREDTLENHKMHSEYFVVSSATLSAILAAKNRGSRVVALGTTVTRTLEYCAHTITAEQKSDLRGEADIFIYPGYKFKTVDAMLTNFHAPKSTVLMMAAAFAGWDNLKRAYDEAIKKEYAFLSYGDSMLII